MIISIQTLVNVGHFLQRKLVENIQEIANIYISNMPLVCFPRFVVSIFLPSVLISVAHHLSRGHPNSYCRFPSMKKVTYRSGEIFRWDPCCSISCSILTFCALIDFQEISCVRLQAFKGVFWNVALSCHITVPSHNSGDHNLILSRSVK